ncbi:MAG: hypothetical protein GAK31_03056 [Stenotrophomonas maltophilia]|uniref:Uncharacterized protein n=1 Tax=Stenotrophomonas maltophilia TaxID=40324 RepID=A0A7V8FEU2_STEMA|nr:MAG: hypothetical protein GAK31_03056 [Stenotrophomonas maltophilia]
MSVDSANHDDVAGLFKRLGARAGAPQYYDFSDDAASEPPPLAPRAVVPAVPVPAASVPVAAAAAGPARELDTAMTPAAVASVPVVEAAVPPRPLAAGATPLQQLFQWLAQAPLQGAGQSPLARLRQR